MKDQHIARINELLSQAFIDIPKETRVDVKVNGLNVDDVRRWVDTSADILRGLVSTGTISMLSESTLQNIINLIDQLNHYANNLGGNTNEIEQNLSLMISQLESFINILAPYAVLVDNMQYSKLNKRVHAKLSEVNKVAKENSELQAEYLKEADSLREDTRNLLRGTTSGALGKNLKILSNSRWNNILMVLSLVFAIWSVVMLIMKSDEITSYLIPAFQHNNLDYRVFLAKWSVSLPYAAILIVALLELRNRIRLRDLYVFRESVAGSLESYTSTLLNHSKQIDDSSERSKAMTKILEYMISSMLELTKSPITKENKQSVGIKIKDYIDAKIEDA